MNQKWLPILGKGQKNSIPILGKGQLVYAEQFPHFGDSVQAEVIDPFPHFGETYAYILPCGDRKKTHCFHDFDGEGGPRRLKKMNGRTKNHGRHD